MNIGFIGYGNMASAIAHGLVKKANYEANKIYACARDFEKLTKNCAFLNINPCQNAKEIISNCDMIILAVKPYQLATVIEDIKKYVEHKIIVSIAANTSFEYLESLFLSNTNIIVTIPNTPISTGNGIMICQDKNSLTNEQYQLFYDLFSKIALIETFDINHLSIAGTIAGCTPAFTAMYLEALGDAGVKYGLTRQVSYNLVAQMLKGVGALYLENNNHPGAMKDAVCSPGGTTIKGVSELEKRAFRGTVIAAIDAIEEK